MPEQIWHPISKLEFFVDYTRRWAIDVREHLETLEEARTKPHVLADSEVARLHQAGRRPGPAQGAAVKWGALPDLSPSRRVKLTTPHEQLAGLRELGKKVLALADELARGTIDTVMAASGAEFGLAVLPGQRPSTPSGLRRTGDPGWWKSDMTSDVTGPPPGPPADG
ncbi:hypothetical protein EYS09_34960 [Streptomyces kasugaensis]|uniref:Uncharacterized protein n=2 Tax=Streptomyces kasugaensis TaxID=1946 RepID=A0A4Q9HKB6_STRKA|nr:hypothetical protein EYS09_34960 [Streptomyces kasugaensis]